MTNPERIWAAVGRGSSKEKFRIMAFDSPDKALMNEATAEMFDDAEVGGFAEYVLASVAAAEREAAAVQMHIDATNGSDAVWHAQLRKVVEERDALRRERDALAARVEKLRTALATVREELCGDDCQTIDEAVALDDALAAAAAKGVG